MVVLILESVPVGLRGELSRWMIEPHPGVFVGSVSGMVRDKLWEKVMKSVKGGGATLLHSSNTEQRFAVRTSGRTRRELLDLEGMTLVVVPAVSTGKRKRVEPQAATVGEDDEIGGSVGDGD